MYFGRETDPQRKKRVPVEGQFSSGAQRVGVESLRALENSQVHPKAHAAIQPSSLVVLLEDPAPKTLTTGPRPTLLSRCFHLAPFPCKVSPVAAHF